MAAMVEKIMKRVRAKGRGWAFTPKDFVDFGTRGSVDMALSRLAKAGKIRRVGRGIYDYPKLHDKLGALSPDTDSIARALASKSGDKIGPAGAAAANRLGLSTQVPARSAYATDGATRTKQVAGRTLVLKHARAPLLDNASDHANTVLQAIAHIGKDGMDSGTIHQFADRLGDADMKALISARPRMTGWMGDVVLRIAQARHG
ncbi:MULTISPECIES: DUF6088 family protein [unclassified Erythrobacter]|jgi:Family of unknown function (DUF6088)|uniref:DUF6088 family protein n=1 Tax=unclassified Erythrobacter TaxID=2633097 RepID=UPI0009EDC11C|nr:MULTISPECIES: DUF6088 family protein [unclassified Erythrobacter]